MVTLTAPEVPVALTALNALLPERVPVATALKLRKMIRTLTQAWEDIDATRQDVITRHAETDEKGAVRLHEHEQARIRPEAQDDFMVAMAALGQTTVEVPDALSPSDFGADLQISTRVLLDLGALLQD